MIALSWSSYPREIARRLRLPMCEALGKIGSEIVWVSSGGDFAVNRLEPI
jgi:hypothetical protein